MAAVVAQTDTGSGRGRRAKPTPVKRKKPKVVNKRKPTVVKKNPYAAPSTYGTQRRTYSAPKKKKEYWGGEDTRLGCESGAEITEKCF